MNGTAVTAVDGELLPPVSSTTSRRAFVPGALDRRSPDKYTLVFNGTGTDPDDRDASIRGTGYLTFTTVDNSTYNIDACLSFCNSISTCGRLLLTVTSRSVVNENVPVVPVFVNLFYEHNNPELDATHSNLKCAAFSDTHTVVEKTDSGGKQLATKPTGPTYIQQSCGYSSGQLVEPETPEGYELVLGPTNGANNAPGVIFFDFRN